MRPAVLVGDAYDNAMCESFFATLECELLELRKFQTKAEASMYAEGQGVEQDYAEAVRWCRRAAEQGHADSQFVLGTLYGTGEGVTQDLVQANMWFNLSASRYRRII